MFAFAQYSNSNGRTLSTKDGRAGKIAANPPVSAGEKWKREDNEQMATTCFFSEKVLDQGGELSMDVELGRSSFYAGCATPSGTGEESIYLSINGNSVIMDRSMATKFVEAVMKVGRYHQLIE
ncbi:hypothetical protein [Rhodobium gokarnense]|uniref:Uncharacterized protein n=1 Tax=Rhodobium gokarnense TaxID=364296 RepID=A0ABT3H6V6_9HYPH|nr:hypothetical protein [Rhodobium gokarnense]MCW2306127.1 hypothetical protein [Rhodobium gokarnense]